MKGPKVSVIIPVLTINEYITKENLPKLNEIAYTDFEVLLLPNEVNEDDKKLMRLYPWLKIIPTGTITRPAQKRDIGAKQSTGDILAFIDDDAYPTRNWLSAAIDEFRNNPDIEVLCGPGILPEDAPFLEKVFDEVLKTWVGSGGLSYRFVPGKRQYVDDYPSMNFLIKKSLFDKVGGFNNDYWPGEDSKLCEDLVYKLGKKILYTPEVVIHHHRRNDVVKYLRQHGQYGFHRGSFFAQGDHNSRRLIYLFPTAFVLYLFIALFAFFTCYLSPATCYRFPMIIYLISIPFISYCSLLSTLFYSAFRNTKSLKIAVMSAIVLFLMHIVYGVQFIHGYVKNISLRNERQVTSYKQIQNSK